MKPISLRSIYFLLCIILIATAVFVIGSCRKSIKSENGEIVNSDVPEWLIEKVREEGHQISVPLNIKSNATFLDNKENERPANFWKNLQLNSNRELTGPCDATDDDFLENIFTLNGFLVYFYGYQQGGFKVEATYTLSTAFTVASANPNNLSQLTRGRIRLRDRVSGTILYNYTSLSLTYSVIGPDPLDANKTLYKLKFETPIINDPNVNVLDVYFDARPIVYTDCEEVIITPSDWQSTPWDVFAAQVCSRVDNISINPAGSSSPGYVYFFGCDAVSPSTYPLGVAKPHEHDVWYDTGSGWTQINFATTLCYVGPYLTFIDTKFLYIGSGSVKFRWRNVKHTTSSCSPNYAISCMGPFQEKTVIIP
jgi:hypothetical protein